MKVSGSEDVTQTDTCGGSASTQDGDEASSAALQGERRRRVSKVGGEIESLVETYQTR